MKICPYLITIFIFCINYPTQATDNDAPFRQQVNNTLRVKLLDTLKAVNVQQKIEYINNSPDTLHEMYIHMWANAFKNNKTQFARQQIRSGNYDFHFARDE